MYFFSVVKTITGFTKKQRENKPFFLFNHGVKRQAEGVWNLRGKGGSFFDSPLFVVLEVFCGYFFDLYSIYVKFLPFGGLFSSEKAEILHTWKIQV